MQGLQREPCALRPGDQCRVNRFSSVRARTGREELARRVRRSARANAARCIPPARLRPDRVPSVWVLEGRLRVQFALVLARALRRADLASATFRVA